VAELMKARVSETKYPRILWEELSIVQHHDAITGTSKQHVANDYVSRLTRAVEECMVYAKEVLPESVGLFYAIKPTPAGPPDESSKKPQPRLGFYESYSGKHNSERRSQASGHYIFRPDCPEGNVEPCTPHPMENIIPHTLNMLPVDGGYSIDWSVGPLPARGAGTEIVLTVSAPWIQNGGSFLTDSNGFEWMSRKVNARQTWDLKVTDPVSGNYYPINAGIVIHDQASSMMVVPDRAVGGSSLRSGEIEIMIHRRTFVDDAKGIEEPLNETGAHGQGIVVSGKTMVFIKSGQFQVPVWALRPPVVLREGVEASSSVAELLGLRMGDKDVIVTHIHRWTPDCPTDKLCVLVRFMNVNLTSVKNVDIRAVFADNQILGQVTGLVEMTANGAWTAETAAKKKIHWIDESVSKKKSLHGSTGNVELAPKDIRTFVVHFIAH
jgi:hypothetical protein